MSSLMKKWLAGRIPYPLPEYQDGTDEEDDDPQEEPQPPPTVGPQPTARGGFRVTGSYDPMTGEQRIFRDDFVPPSLTLATLAQSGQYPIEIGPNPARAQQTQAGALSPADESFNRNNQLYQEARAREQSATGEPPTAEQQAQAGAQGVRLVREAEDPTRVRAGEVVDAPSLTKQLKGSPEAKALRRDADFQAQNASSAGDTGSIPAGQRMQAVEDASGAQTAGGAESASAGTGSEKPDELTALMAELVSLNSSPIVNKNSRLKSMVLTGLATMSNMGIAHNWQELMYQLGRGAGGAIAGAVDPSTDERLQSEVQAEQRLSAINRRLTILKTLGSLKTKQQQGERRAAQMDARERMALYRELKERMKLSAGKFNPEDPRQAELAAKLSITPKSKGASINWQRVRTVQVNGRDHLVYLDFDDDGQVTYRRIKPEDGETEDFPPDELREIQNAIQLENVNTNRARTGQPPLQINSQQPAPAGGTQAPAQTTAPAQPQAAPQGAGTPQSSPPLLSPVPGAQAPQLPRRGGYGRRGARRVGSSSGNAGGTSRDESINANIGMREIGEIDDLNTRAKVARQRGETKEAEAYEQEAKARARRLVSNPNFKGKYEVSYDPDDFMQTGGRYPVVRPKQDKAHGGRPSMGVRRSVIRTIAEQQGRNVDEVEQAALEQGFGIIEDEDA